MFGVFIIRNKVGYLGPSINTYCGIVAKRTFKENENLIPYKSLLELTDAIEREEIDYAVVPIEPISGRLTWIDKGLMDCDNVSIHQIIKLHLTFCLGAYGEPDEIEEVHSKEEALIPCRKELKKFNKNMRFVTTDSTVAAAKKIAQLKSRKKAALCSEQSIEEYDLKKIKKMYSATSFYVLSTKEQPAYDPTEKYETLILYTLPGSVDTPDTLNQSLIFGKYGVNLTNINSIPDRDEGEVREYIFSVLAQGHKDEVPLKDVLEELKTIASDLYVKGSGKLVNMDLQSADNSDSGSKIYLNRKLNAN